jgi:hypothetical protein
MRAHAHMRISPIHESGASERVSVHALPHTMLNTRHATRRQLCACVRISTSHIAHDTTYLCQCNHAHSSALLGRHRRHVDDERLVGASKLDTCAHTHTHTRARAHVLTNACEMHR